MFFEMENGMRRYVIALGVFIMLWHGGLSVMAREKAKNFPSVYPSLPPKGPAIVLTFDDGPRPWILPNILLLLDTYKIRAAFFLQGWQAEEHPRLVKKLWEAGHTVGNHTWNHAPLKWYVDRYGEIDGVERYLKDVESGARVIEKIIEGRPREFFFRPPLWDINERVFEILKKTYIVQILDEPRFRPRTKDPFVIKRSRETRDVNTEDYAFHARYKRSPKEAKAALAKRVRTIIKAREKEGLSVHILTFHELPVSRDALEVLIPEWEKEGYKFCTLRWVYGVEGCK